MDGTLNLSIHQQEKLKTFIIRQRGLIRISRDSRDNSNSTEFGRKRKADLAETHKSAKVSKLNDAGYTLTDQGKDTFRTGQESRRYPFSRRTFGGPKGLPPPRK